MARQRGGTQSTPLTEHDVLEAALLIVERSGLDRLTVRAVADELGVTPPAVHYHLRGGDDLTDRVVEAVAARIRIEIDPNAHWVDQYIALVTSMDRTFLRYPGTGTRVLTAFRDSAAAERLTGTALSILREAGFAEPTAVELFTVTHLLFTGWLATRALVETGGTHPALAAAGAGTTAADDGSTLERALRVLLENTSPNTRRPAGEHADHPRRQEERMSGASTLEAYYTAWDNGDIDAIMKTLSDDVVIEDVPTGHIAHGSTEARAFVTGALRMAPGAKYEVVSTQINADDTYAVEWIMQPAGLRGASVGSFREGLISANRDYWNAAGLPT